jgi:hypothetical protein
VDPDAAALIPRLGRRRAGSIFKKWAERKFGLHFYPLAT